MTRIARAVRAFTRELSRRSAAYDAADGGRRWADAPLITAPNTQGAAAAGAILPRARHAYQSNSSARALVGTLVAATVGTGFTPVSTHDPALSDVFTRWTDSADATGLQDFEGMTALLALMMFRDGEAFVQMTADPDTGALRLRLIPCEQVDRSLHRDLGDGARIIGGIEFDRDGRRVAFHVFPDSPDMPFASALETVRITADDMLHIFRPTHAGQVRGVSALASVLTMLRELDKTMDAQVVRQQLGAALAGFIYDQEGGAGGFEGEARGSVLEGGLEPGTLKVLPPRHRCSVLDPADHRRRRAGLHAPCAAHRRQRRRRDL